jgi:undecaprenyl phosphate-alpha-L-ara4N flippase subunit ArnE
MGQLLFKVGATGRTVLLDFVNVYIATGLALYAVGTMLWIAALSKAPLSAAYPFTALTFVLVVVFSAIFLREGMSGRGMAGTALVLAGLWLVYSGSRG